MDDQSPTEEPESLGRRILAAIMFTDAVGFSRQVGENEDRGLRLVSRDLKQIAKMVKLHDGRVLKHTGDGCLAFFSSGVQAVACAQEIQQHFAEQARTLPAEEVLQHRIGIHLGDVYLSGNEVMGDGVNVAARLQSEAPPGGICITQALYEVAKNRLALQTVHLGPRQLKNIPESVQLYQVLVDSERNAGGVSFPASLRRLPQRNWLIAGAVVVAVIILVVVAVKLMSEAPEAAPPDDTAPPAQYAQIKSERLRVRDYQGLADWIEEKNLEEPGAGLHADFVKYRRLAELFRWLDGGLESYTEASPLIVSSPRAGKISIWSEGEGGGQVAVKTASTAKRTVTLRLAQEHAFILNVMAALARDKWKEESTAKGSANGRLLAAMYLFAQENGLEAERLLAELKRPATETRGTQAEDPESEIFLRFDKNSDGKLTADELPQALRQRMMRADANRDGALTPAELRDARRRMPPRPRRP